MIRDARMAALVAKDKEPITPFRARVRALYEARAGSRACDRVVAISRHAAT